MPNLYEKRMLRVLAYIHANPAGDLSLDTLADVAAMSRFHWHRVFQAMTGETCAQATRRIRLHRAACWLVQTDDTIAQVAKRCGYPSAQSFTRAFSEAFGTSQEIINSHIKVYGADNDQRLTGAHETQSIDKFSFGVSDRGASIRIPIATVENGYKGWLEDRRPASNADPYKVASIIIKTVKRAKL